MNFFVKTLCASVGYFLSFVKLEQEILILMKDISANKEKALKNMYIDYHYGNNLQPRIVVSDMMYLECSLN